MPGRGFVAALVVFGLVLFLLPPAARVWAALLVVVMALSLRGRSAAGLIDNLSRQLYGGG